MPDSKPFPCKKLNPATPHAVQGPARLLLSQLRRALPLLQVARMRVQAVARLEGAVGIRQPPSELRAGEGGGGAALAVGCAVPAACVWRGVTLCPARLGRLGSLPHLGLQASGGQHRGRSRGVEPRAVQQLQLATDGGVQAGGQPGPRRAAHHRPPAPVAHTVLKHAGGAGVDGGLEGAGRQLLPLPLLPLPGAAVQLALPLRHLALVHLSAGSLVKPADVALGGRP